MINRRILQKSSVGLLALTLSVGAGVPPEGWAAEPADDDSPRVLLVPLQRDPATSSVVPGRVQEYLETILKMNRKLKILSFEDLRREPQPKPKRVEETDPTLKKADKALWDAKELVTKGKAKDAVKVFKNAMRLYEKRFDELADFDKYVDAALGVALSWFVAGYDDNGEDALARVISLRPDTVLDKRRVPKKAVEALERLRLLYTKAELGKIEVTASPDGADVYLDGVLKGKSPVTLSGMYRGKHVVRVVEDGHEPWAKVVSASARDTKLKASLKAVATPAGEAPIKVVPESLIAYAKDGGYDRAFNKLAEAVAAQHRLDTVVLTYIRKTDEDYQLAAFVYDRDAKELAGLDWIHIDHELATMQANLLVLEEQLLTAIAVFPSGKVVGKGKPAIYVAPPPKKPPVVAAAPAVLAKPVVPTKPIPAPVAVPVRPVPPPTVVAAPGAKPVISVVPAPDSLPAPTVMRPPGARHVPGTAAAPDIRVVAAPGTAPAIGADGKKPWEVYDKDGGTSEPWYEKWWVWTIVGVAVAGGATAAVLVATSGSDSPSGFRTTVSWR